jgi:aqualysin 1
MPKSFLLCILCALVAAVLTGPVHSQPLSDPSPWAQAERGAPIPDHYVIVLRDDVADPRATSARLGRQVGAQIGHVYTHALRGFSARLSPQALGALQRNPLVAYIEQDATVYLGGSTQTNATWGLDRIDQPGLPLNQTYTFGHTGLGVTAYVIDSGIRYAHVDFGGRARLGVDYVGDGRAGDDCNGHGTHVAGTIGGTTWGVAKEVALVSVRVFGCTGGASWSRVIAAVDWVTANGVRPAVVNMSLGGGTYQPLNDAVSNSVNAGFVYAVAAGNDGADACNTSPASTPSALTVGASTSSDARASFSNWGNCVDLFAPGASISSAWYTSNTAAASLSGTSMAAPHVAGVAALLFQQSPTASPAEIEVAMINAVARGVVTSSLSVNNNLVQSLATIGSPEPAPPTVISVGVTNIGETSAQALGDVTGSGTSSVSARGVCYALAPASVSTGICQAATTAGTGSFNVPLTGLAADSLYAVRAFATNDIGTNYGETLGFRTLAADLAPPSVNSLGSTLATNGRWRDVRVSWDIADDRALLSIVIEIRRDANTLSSVSLAVSGTQASGQTDQRVRSDPDEIRVTVTDVAGKVTRLSCAPGTTCVGSGAPPPEDDPIDDQPPGALTGSATKQGRVWTATVTLSGVIGQQTQGSWSTGASGGCTITSGTQCSFSLQNLSNGTASVSYIDPERGTVTILKP